MQDFKGFRSVHKPCFFLTLHIFSMVLYVSSAAIAFLKTNKEASQHSSRVSKLILLSSVDLFSPHKDIKAVHMCSCTHTHLSVSSEWLDFRELYGLNRSVLTKKWQANYSLHPSSPLFLKEKFRKFVFAFTFRNKIWTLITTIGFVVLLETISYFNTDTRKVTASCQVHFLKTYFVPEYHIFHMLLQLLQ